MCSVFNLRLQASNIFGKQMCPLQMSCCKQKFWDIRVKRQLWNNFNLALLPPIAQPFPMFVGRKLSLSLATYFCLYPQVFMVCNVTVWWTQVWWLVVGRWIRRQGNWKVMIQEHVFMFTFRFLVCSCFFAALNSSYVLAFLFWEDICGSEISTEVCENSVKNKCMQHWELRTWMDTKSCQSFLIMVGQFFLSFLSQSCQFLLETKSGFISSLAVCLSLSKITSRVFAFISCFNLLYNPVLGSPCICNGMKGCNFKSPPSP